MDGVNFLLHTLKRGNNRALSKNEIQKKVPNTEQ